MPMKHAYRLNSYGKKLKRDLNSRQLLCNLCRRVMSLLQDHM